MFVSYDFKLTPERQMENRIGFYIYSGISDDIKYFKRRTEILSEEERQQALDLLQDIIKYYQQKYVLSSKYLWVDYEKLKSELGGQND